MNRKLELYFKKIKRNKIFRSKSDILNHTKNKIILEMYDVLDWKQRDFLYRLLINQKKQIDCDFVE